MSALDGQPASGRRLRAITVRRALLLPTGERVDARITVHVTERFTERVRWAADPEHAAAELARLLKSATVHDRRPRELRSSPSYSDFYVQLSDWWMPAVRDEDNRNLIVIKTILAPTDLRRHKTRQLLERKRRKMRNAARRAAERRQRAYRRR